MKKGIKRNKSLHKNQKEIELKLLILFKKEGKYTVEYCPALDISGYGYNEYEAKSSFEDNLIIFFEETTKKGNLDNILLNLGWTIKKKPTPFLEPPSYITSESVPLFQKAESFSTEKVKIPLIA